MEAGVVGKLFPSPSFASLSYIHAYIHTYLLTYLHAYLHAYLLTYVHTYMLAT